MVLKKSNYLQNSTLKFAIWRLADDKDVSSWWVKWWSSRLCFSCRKLTKAGPPWFEFLVIFDFFAPWYRKSRGASRVKIALKKFKGKVGQKLLTCIGFLNKVVHKISRLRKFNRSCEIEFNFLTVWTISMKFGTLVQHAPGYKNCLRFFNFCPGTWLWSFKVEKKSRVKSWLNFERS